jgi:hypothetical protein
MLRALFVAFAIIVVNTGAGAQLVPGFPKAASPKYSVEPTRQKRLAKPAPSAEAAKSGEITPRTRSSRAEQGTLALGAGCQAPLTTASDEEGAWGQGCPIGSGNSHWRYWCTSGQVFEFTDGQAMPEGGLSGLCGAKRTALIPARGAAAGAAQRSGAPAGDPENPSHAKDEPDQFAAMIANSEIAQCRSTPYPEIRVDVKAEYEAVFLDNERLTPLLNYLWKMARVVCDEEVRLQGVSPGPKLSTFISVRLQFNNEVAGFVSGDGVKWEGENRIGQKIRQRQLEQLAREQTRQDAQGQVQKVTLRQKLILQYGIDTWASRRELVANPFSFRGRIIGVSVSFGQMLSDKEAIFSSDGELVVTRVPSTMFRGNESVILAAKVVGTKSMRTATGSEITVPYLEFVSTWPLAEKRGQIIRHLADALALDAEIQNGQIRLLIERALDEVLTPIQAGATSGGGP